LQQRHFRSHFHDLADLAHLKSDINVRALLYFDRNWSAYEVLESLFFHVNPVLAGKQIHEGEEAVAAAGLGALFCRAQVGQRHVGVRNCGSGGIRYRPCDRAISALAVERNGGRYQHAHRDEQTPEYASWHK